MPKKTRKDIFDHRMEDKAALAVADIQKEAFEFLEKLRHQRIIDLDLLSRKLSVDYDNFVYVATKLCRTPIALITLIDGSHQFIRKQIGFDGMPMVMPRSDAFCDIAIQMPDQVLVIPDARIDDRFKNTPLVMNNKIRFYAGAPLTTKDGLALGAICVIDGQQARDLDQDQRDGLLALSKLATSMLTHMI